MTAPILRPSREGDYDALYAERLGFTIWAETAEIDGRPVGIGGIAYVGNRPVLFSRMTDELRPHRKFIVRCARRAAEMARIAHAAAVANPKEPLSCRLLQRMGLVWQGTMAEGEVYSWPIRHADG